ncbi:MAG: peptidoglycan bridge formation glycyltransferase FemA/FemB family protein [Candidatus Staskawiczbacteria bacterium]|jgi:lipid II:glycine glycyltransferase (peptidoglycan interpeptide bridge formation enzyme)
MSIIIKEIESKAVWEDFLEKCEEKTFLQSWNGGEFQKVQGNNKIWRLGMYEDNQLQGVSLVRKISARRGKFLFIPHGPLVIKNKELLFTALIKELIVLAKKEKASFIRVSSFWERDDENTALFKKLRFIKAPMHMHAEITWELDITPTEEQLLSGMRKTTRYLIKQAQKNPDIKIEKSEDIEDIKKFLPVYRETARRHHFTEYSEDYLRTQFSAFSGDKQIQFFFGKYKGEIISSAIFVFWQNCAFYHHSGSLVKYSKIPMNYLLQWEAIKEAKTRGCRIYNFWGISPGIKTEEDAKNSSHPWAGLSLFKMGFGGYRRELVKTQDLIISPAYWINYAIEKLRKIKRRL